MSMFNDMSLYFVPPFDLCLRCLHFVHFGTRSRPNTTSLVSGWIFSECYEVNSPLLKSLFRLFVCVQCDEHEL